MQFTQIDDVTVHYDLQGPPAAPVLVLLHSLGTDIRIFDDLVPALARSRRVLRCDLRGHGLTAGGIDPAAPATTIDALAGDVLGLLDRLGITEAAVGGVSIGGMVALALAARAPERVGRLVLCATGYRIGTPEMWRERAAQVTGQGLASIAEATLGRWVTPGFAAARPAAAEGLKSLLLRTPVAGYIAGCAALAAADLEAAARAIVCPTLVVVGDQDTATPHATAAALCAAIPGATLRVVETAGHIPTVEQPDLLVDLLETFLAAPAAVSSTYESGLAMRMAVLGTAHVERSLAKATAFDRDFQTYVIEHVWNAVWTRGTLAHRTRSLLTLSILAALGHHEEFKLHLRATRQTGATPDEVREMLLHVAAYAGVPAANTAFRLAREAYQELKDEDTPT